MEKMSLYEKTRAVPKEAKSPIKGGRLVGMTDIKPMWRIKKLTELFGPVGFGWNYKITEKRFEQGANGEIAVFVDIELKIRMTYEGTGEEMWSEPIPGTGGSMFVASEKKGTQLYTSDEAVKMATTDAISVACKCLGMGADVYFDKDKTKYDNEQKESNPPQQAGQAQIAETKDECPCGKTINYGKKKPEEWKALSMKMYGANLCRACINEKKSMAE